MKRIGEKVFVLAGFLVLFVMPPCAITSAVFNTISIPYLSYIFSLAALAVLVVAIAFALIALVIQERELESIRKQLP